MNIVTANRLLKYRKLHNLSQEELAEKIGVSRQAISKWERAEASPDTDNLVLLAQVYGVTLDELLQGEDEPRLNTETEFAPDENTEYVEKGKAFKKGGIHIKNERDEVEISLKNGINVKNAKGEKVHVGFDGVNIHDGTKTRAYTSKDGVIMVDKELEEKREHNRNFANTFPLWAIALAVMLAWGFSGILCGWALSWVALLFIPLYHSTVEAIYKRTPALFAYPVLCVIIYMFLGFLVSGGWAWGWIVFLTIPIFYAIANRIKK